MAINKVVNRKTSSHGAMRNCLEYVLRDNKIKEGYVEVTGPYAADTIHYDDVYRSWIQEKKIWNKDNGRMYAHNVISFHKDEIISPEQVMEIGRTFCNTFFPEHQCLIGVHQDKEHLHCHIVTNSVSYIDGHKLHQKKQDLQRQKDFTNTLCLKTGLSVAQKGFHFDGSPIEEGEVIAWNKNSYNMLLHNPKKSHIAKCAMALMDVLPCSGSREEFFSGMKKHGWTVHWEDSRKHIVFQNDYGDKVRDSTIEKNISMNIRINKEDLLHEFKRNNAIRRAITGAGDDLRTFLSDIDAKEQNLGNAVKTSISDSRNGRGTAISTESQSVINQAQRSSAEQLRIHELERATETRKQMSRSRSHSR